MTNPKLQTFIDKHMLPGFYIDVTGCYSIVIYKYLISVFLNSDTDELEVTMDTISDRGFFDQDIEWETPASDEEIVATIKRFMLRAARD